MSIRFKLVSNPEIKLELSYIDAQDLLMLLNRPKDAQEQRGQWNMETVNELLGKALKLKQMEAQDMCDSFFKIDTKIGDMYTLLKKAVDINSEIIFN